VIAKEAGISFLTEEILTMSSSSSDHKEVVRQEFTHQAQAYAASPMISDQDRLNRLVQAVQPRSQSRVLDVATGPGYVAMAFAEAGCQVVGIDLTEAPLAIAEQKRQERGLTNLHFLAGDAEHLPFAEQEFDIVVSRFALHHCEAPLRVLAEMARVCRSQGLVVIEDMVVSEYPARAAYQNRFEQLRDPSHTSALSISALLAYFTECALEVERLSTDQLTQPVEKWLANAHTPEERAEQVRAMIEQDELRDLSGTHPFLRNGKRYFQQRIATFVGRRLAMPPK
jgi:ubiquinone/menaquinone biosynthesis C-methylase UbiE